MKNAIDQAIVEVYASFPHAADAIVSSPDRSAEFADQVNSRLSEDEQCAVEAINKRLLTLRKRGEDKGGLPRRWRGYNGRINDN